MYSTKGRKSESESRDSNSSRVGQDRDKSEYLDPHSDFLPL